MRFFLNILLCLPLIGFSQNYIQDGSFEDKNGCPPSYGLSKLNKWYTPNFSSSDYICDCFPSDSFNLGSRNAYDSTCMIGLVLHHPPSGQNDPREYAEVKLESTLEIGEKYCISLFAMLSPTSNYAISNIHVGFRTDSGYANTGGIIGVDTIIPLTQSILNDTTNWTRLEVEYTASGYESFLTIGNFDSVNTLNVFDFNAITNPPYLQNYAYYFFDLITLEKCVEPPPIPDNHFSIYPNPSNGNTISIDKYNDTTAQLTLYNSIGQLVASKELATGTYNGVVFEHLASGVYVVIYETATGYREEEKVIVSP